jgi:hypothetical protein
MTRQYRMQIAEPDPGRVLTESDTNSGTLTTWTVTPQGDDSCVVQLASRWDGAPGVAGFMERTFAPRVLRRLYADELRRLDWYARDHADE